MTNVVRDTGTPIGRGVFATNSYFAGVVVEVAHVIVLELVPEVAKYVYEWYDGKVALALGQATLYNHSDHANLSYVANRDEQVIRFIASRYIHVSEQLTINYNGDGGVGYDWFREHGVVKMMEVE